MRCAAAAGAFSSTSTISPRRCRAKPPAETAPASEVAAQLADAAGAAARRAAVDRGRQRLDQGYRGEILDERGRGAGGAASRAGQPDGEATGTVRMDTDQLIRTLAADNAHRARPVGFVLTLALLAAAPVSLSDVLRRTRRPARRDDCDAQSVLRPEIRGDAGAGDRGDRRQPASVAARSLAARLWLAAAGPGRDSGRGDRRRDDDAAAAADDDAAGRQEFGGSA